MIETVKNVMEQVEPIVHICIVYYLCTYPMTTWMIVGFLYFNAWKLIIQKRVYNRYDLVHRIAFQTHTCREWVDLVVILACQVMIEEMIFRFALVDVLGMTCWESSVLFAILHYEGSVTKSAQSIGVNFSYHVMQILQWLSVITPGLFGYALCRIRVGWDLSLWTMTTFHFLWNVICIGISSRSACQ